MYNQNPYGQNPFQAQSPTPNFNMQNSRSFPTLQPIGGGGYYQKQGGTNAYKGSYQYKKQQQEQMLRNSMPQQTSFSVQQNPFQNQSQFQMAGKRNSNASSLSYGNRTNQPSLTPIDHSNRDQEQMMNIQRSIQQQRDFRMQQQTLVKELRNIERRNQMMREEKIFKLLESATKQKKIKKIPPPLAQLPYHHIPKKLVTELGITPPLTINANKAGEDPKKMDKKLKQQMLANGQIFAEVFNRRIDPETGQYVDLVDDNPDALEQAHQGQFIGLSRNEDDVTKILISKEDLLRDKLNRQVVFGPDGKPIVNLEEGAGDDQLEGLLDLDDPEAAELMDIDGVPLIDRLRQELAVDKQKQQKLQHELDIPQFKKDEVVEVDEDEISPDEDELDAEDGENKEQTKARNQNYQKIKERLKKGYGKDKLRNDGRLLKTVFKLSAALIQVFGDVKIQRNIYRDQGIHDFKNALPLYNEVLRGWIIRCVKTPILTVIKQPDQSMDFIPLDNAIMTAKGKNDKFLLLKIRVNTIFQNLILNATPKQFPQPLMTFLNSFMKEGGFVPYDFLTEFEQDIFEFDSSDSLMNFGPKQKFLFIGSFIITQFLIDRVLLRPEQNGFNTEILPKPQENLKILAAMIHGIYSEVMYDTFKSILIERKVLLDDEENRAEIIEDYIYHRYRYCKKLIHLELLDYAYSPDFTSGAQTNKEWWDEMKEKCAKFIVLIYKLLENQ